MVQKTNTRKWIRKLLIAFETCSLTMSRLFCGYFDFDYFLSLFSGVVFKCAQPTKRQQNQQGKKQKQQIHTHPQRRDDWLFRIYLRILTRKRKKPQKSTESCLNTQLEPHRLGIPTQAHLARAAHSCQWQILGIWKSWRLKMSTMSTRKTTKS